MTYDKKTKDVARFVEEWKELFSDAMAIWCTPEVLGEVTTHVGRFFSKRAKHYYDIDEFGMDKNLVTSIRPLFQFLYNNYWRVSVRGVENIPHVGRTMIVANHSGAIPFDGIMLNMAVYNEHPASRHVRFLVEDFVYHFPFLGTLIARTGGVRACPENAERLLEKNKLVAIFPEGVKGLGKLYKNRYQLLRFSRGGYIKMAIKTGATLIPTAIIGAEETYPIIAKTTALAKPLGIPYFPITPTFPILGPIGLVPLPSKWSITFGKPIKFDRYKKKEAENNILVHRLNQRVRNEVLKLIDNGLKSRTSVWK